MRTVEGRVSTDIEMEYAGPEWKCQQVKRIEKDTESDKKVIKRYAENLENCEQIIKINRLLENRDIYLLF